VQRIWHVGCTTRRPEHGDDPGTARGRSSDCVQIRRGRALRGEIAPLGPTRARCPMSSGHRHRAPLREPADRRGFAVRRFRTGVGDNVASTRARSAALPSAIIQLRDRRQPSRQLCRRRSGGGQPPAHLRHRLPDPR
jgi:hypothetical protein